MVRNKLIGAYVASVIGCAVLHERVQEMISETLMSRYRPTALLLAVLLTAALVRPAIGTCPLEVARSLADEKFQDYTYGTGGHKPEDQTIDCTAFLRVVVDELARRHNLSHRITPQGSCAGSWSAPSPGCISSDDFVFDMNVAPTSIRRSSRSAAFSSASERSTRHCVRGSKAIDEVRSMAAPGERAQYYIMVREVAGQRYLIAMLNNGEIDLVAANNGNAAASGLLRGVPDGYESVQAHLLMGSPEPAQADAVAVVELLYAPSQKSLEHDADMMLDSATHTVS